MAIFRCKMCGGDLKVQEGATTCFCGYCGTQQTIPTNKDEKLQGLFNRANVLRMKAEFDKAADVYEKILLTDQTEAEAYWGLILCKYGIEYVEDPATYKRIPTCHRASYDPVRTDEDYRNALKYADVVQRKVYEAEAAKIDEIQKGILALAHKESPYDVFICYKETDDRGNRTQDYVLATDIYYQLTNEGFKVFFAAISLEDKLGSEYEPVIFSAINTAKVMLVVGTKPEYFNAVWVRNEWSRFLKIIQKDRTKLLIPCYKGMDPYELPEEFAHLQAQNMDKIGFSTDLIRGIKKVLDFISDKDHLSGSRSESKSKENDIDKLLKRGKIALEDNEWVTADALFEQVLAQDIYCAPAYYGKFLARYHIGDDQSQYTCLTAANKGSIPASKDNFPEDFRRKGNSHITDMANRYAVPGILDAEDIVNYYTNHVNNCTCSSTYKREVENIKNQTETILSDKTLARAEQYGNENLKDQINQLKLSIQKKSSELILQAKTADEAKKNNEFNKCIQIIDKEIVSKSEEAQKMKKDKDMQYLISYLAYFVLISLILGGILMGLGENNRSLRLIGVIFFALFWIVSIIILIISKRRKRLLANGTIIRWERKNSGKKK